MELDVLLPPLATSLNEVRVQGETGWLILRGPRSGQELETLLMRMQRPIFLFDRSISQT